MDLCYKLFHKPHTTFNNYFQLSFFKIFFDISSSLLLSILIVELCFYIDTMLNRFLPWSNNTYKRLILQTFIHLILHFLLLIIYAALTLYFIKVFEIKYDEIKSRKIDLYYFLVSFTFLTLLVSFINSVYFLSTSWKKEIMTLTKYQIREAENKQIIAQSSFRAD